LVLKRISQGISVTWSQSYDRNLQRQRSKNLQRQRSKNLQRQRSKNLQRHELSSAFGKKNIFLCLL
jgi:hypothetical protein